jgi:hypothetical protein
MMNNQQSPKKALGVRYTNKQSRTPIYQSQFGNLESAFHL